MQATIEEAIEAATGESVSIEAAGRTDAGAHALKNVIAFRTESALSADTLRSAMNARLPDDVVITAATEAQEDFHPRYDASSRTYRYLIWNRRIRSPFWKDRAAHVKAPLDEQAMHAALQVIVGTHDFSVFVPAAEKENAMRTIYSASCSRAAHLITIDIEATGFMRQMVRAIAGTIVEAGLGKLSPAELRGILDSRDRRHAGESMPAAGLYLIDVSYAAEWDSLQPAKPVAQATSVMA